MPELKTRNYHFTGWATVKIYSQEEMGQALDISTARLVDALETGQVGLSYHAHPRATGDGYEFNQSSYDNNIRVWNCYRSGGHNYQVDPKRDYLPDGAKTCATCGHEKFG